MIYIILLILILISLFNNEIPYFKIKIFNYFKIRNFNCYYIVHYYHNDKNILIFNKEYG